MSMCGKSDPVQPPASSGPAPSGPALTQLSMQSQLKTTPAHSLTAHFVWAVDNMHTAFMHAYFLPVSETRLINTSSNWYSASFSVIQTFHQRPLTYKADISTQVRQATYQKPFQNKDSNLNLFTNSEGVKAVILYLQYFANSERLKSHKVIIPLISKILSSLRCHHSSCFS